LAQRLLKQGIPNPLVDVLALVSVATVEMYL